MTDCVDGVETVGSVKVGMTRGRGRGLFATRAMTKGDIVLVERPLVAMQSLDNTQDVMVCRNCLGFVGNVVSQLELLSGTPRHECLQRLHEQASMKKTQGERDAGVLSGVFSCLQGCGEVYCSFQCRQDHFDRCHSLLCVGPIPEEEAPTHPLVAFRVHAMQTNEIFLLVGEVVARVVSTFSKNGGVLSEAMAPFADFVQEPWWDVAVSRPATAVPNSSECAKSSASTPPPEDSTAKTASRSRPSSEATSVTLSHTLRSLCAESCDLLRRALGSPPNLDVVLCAGRFGRVVGMFEQNNVGVRVSSPIPTLLQSLIYQSAESEGTTGRPVEILLDEVAGLVRRLELQEEEDLGWDDVDYSSDEEERRDGVEDKHHHNSRVSACDLLPTSEIPHAHTYSEEHDCCSVEEGGRNASVGKSLCNAPHSGFRKDEDPLQIVRSAIERSRDDDEAERLFAPLDGTALYTLICCMNHSCRPNCVVRYPGIKARKSIHGQDETGVRIAHEMVANVVLLENVSKGDELTQSYVDDQLSLEDRRRALEDYGFVCECPRCLEEETQRGSL